MTKKTVRILSVILALAVVLAAVLTVCIIFIPPKGEAQPPAASDGQYPSASDDIPMPEDPYPDTRFESGMKNTSKVGFSAEYLGTAERHLPVVSDGGLPAYPVYGETFSATEEEKQAVLDENTALLSSASTYDGMDAEGNLYLNGEPTGGKLYKHTAAAGMYEGDLSDDEPAVVKRMTFRARSGGNHLTGLYAPAGETVKVEMSEEDLARTGGLKIYIGQALANGNANNIWLARDFNRMPCILNTMTVQTPTAYVGSFLGGPIYIQPINASENPIFTVTVSGAVPYSHFLSGYTTEEEFEQNRRSTAPYFDLEVWDDAVRHSGPKSRAEEFDYAELTEAAVLWDKIARVSNAVPAGSGGDTGIVFLYDPFIAAGSMVAFVGAHGVNCPLHCLTAALDADSAVDNASDSFWGCIHEFNHHFQRYGFAPGDEVTNNAVSLAEYALFTRISSNRSLGNAAEGNYAVTWNRYTNPSWCLRQTVAGTSVNSDLDSYANLLHAFGPDLFIRATQEGGGSGGADVWYRAVSDVTHNDMTYYFRDLLHQNVSEDIPEEYAAKEYPVFVPVASIYQTGRSYTVDGEKLYSRTAQPYGIEAGKDFTFDLKDSIVVPDGFEYTVKNVTAPLYGSLREEEAGTYVYTPDPDHRSSGEMIATIGIERTDGAFEVGDVDLIIELRQEQYRPSVLERTVYTYDADAMYSSAAEAYENDYAGYAEKREEDNDNRVQNGNAEIWEPNPSSDAVMEISGKFRVPADGRYRVALRGRRSAALYVSVDGEMYEEAARLENTAGGVGFDVSDGGPYRDYVFEKGQWVRFKAVLLVDRANAFIGVGLGRIGADGETAQISYLDAYRNAYEREPFSSDYFYTHDYRYDYTEPRESAQSLVETNYRPWGADYPIDALFDEDDTNFIHSDRTPITAENPFELTVDLGSVIDANRLIIYGEPTRQYQPKNFRLYGGTDPEALELLADVTDAPLTGNDVIVDFPERELRYYKLVVTDTRAGGTKYIAYRRAAFARAVPGGALHSPDEDMFVYKGDWSLAGRMATFGHLYVGQNASVEFSFTGTRFGVFSLSSAEQKGFEVLIDGKEAGYVSLQGEEGIGLSYFSDELPAGDHTVVLRGRGKFNVDSFAVWE